MKMMSDLSQKMDDGFAKLNHRVDRIQEVQEAIFDELQITRTHVEHLLDRDPPSP